MRTQRRSNFAFDKIPPASASGASSCWLGSNNRMISPSTPSERGIQINWPNDLVTRSAILVLPLPGKPYRNMPRPELMAGPRRFIIPGLIAIWIDRQGLVETFSIMAIASIVVRLVLITLGLEVPT